VREATRRIALSPLLFPVELDEVRRYVMNRFPYTLRYVLRGEDVWIMTVSHQHRSPDYWVERVG
jgi:toxin ParE1/3/4